MWGHMFLIFFSLCLWEGGCGGSILSGSMRSSMSMSFASRMDPYIGSTKTITITELERATNRFISQNILEEGGFGRVYHGVLEDGTKVAVKVLTRDEQQGGRDFIAEVEMLSLLHHRNLVKLIGICTEEHNRSLVYELIPNGSVESHLHGMPFFEELFLYRSVKCLNIPCLRESVQVLPRYL